MYDPDGQRVRTIGGPGEGPGEFQSPTTFGVLGDTVWVSDSRLRRMTLFTRAGDLLATVDANGVRVPTPPGVTIFIRPGRLRPDGLIEGTQMLAFAVGVELSDPVIVPKLLFDLTGAVVDTISVDTMPPPGVVTMLERIPVGAIEVTKPQPPSDRSYVLTGDDAETTIDRPHATGDDDAIFTVTRTRADADTAYHLRFRYAPHPYEGAVLDYLVEARAQTYEERAGGDYEAVKKVIRDAWELPPFQAPVSLVFEGRDGALWIRRQDEGADTFTWIVIDADGNPKGRVRMSRNANIEWATADQAWVVEPDEYDVQWLVRYSLRG